MEGLKASPHFIEEMIMDNEEALNKVFKLTRELVLHCKEYNIEPKIIVNGVAWDYWAVVDGGDSKRQVPKPLSYRKW